eukprot:7799591-Pyramimonas_sp.AAC.1
MSTLGVAANACASLGEPWRVVATRRESSCALSVASCAGSGHPWSNDAVALLARCPSSGHLIGR